MLRVLPYRDFRVGSHVRLSSLTLIMSTLGDMRDMIYYVVASSLCVTNAHVMTYHIHVIEIAEGPLFYSAHNAQLRLRFSHAASNLPTTAAIADGRIMMQWLYDATCAALPCNNDASN